MKSSILMGSLARPGWDENVSSLLSQSVPADEIIVVVDRATDPAERETMEQKWPQLRFLFNESNIGLTASLNRGLACARGEFIFRADDDDWYFPSRLERQLAEFERTGADFVGGWAEGRTGDRSSYLIRTPTTDSEIRTGLLTRNVILHPSLAFRTELVRRLGGYDETFIYAQDYALYLAALRAGARFAAVPEPVLRRTYSPDSITVGRRYHQLMYSCAARMVHCAHSGDRRGFVRAAARYAMLAATPASARRWRRMLFGLIGRGA
jgi:glycosyltransferase involved in cell wall biosynthesis